MQLAVASELLNIASSLLSSAVTVFQVDKRDETTRLNNRVSWSLHPTARTNVPTLPGGGTTPRVFIKARFWL